MEVSGYEHGNMYVFRGNGKFWNERMKSYHKFQILVIFVISTTDAHLDGRILKLNFFCKK